MRDDDWRRAPDAYGEPMALPTRYADVDALRHLNNVAVGALHLEARMRWLSDQIGVSAWSDDGPGFRAVDTVTEFLGEGSYPEDVTAGVRCLDVDSDRIILASGLFQKGVCIGLQQTRLACWQGQAPAALGADLVQRLRATRSAPTTVPLSAAQPADPRGYLWYLDIPSRFSDMDADGTAGEIAMSRCMETARARAVREGLPALMGAFQATGMNVVVGRVSLHMRAYRAPALSWRAGVRIDRVGTASYTVACGLFDGDDCVATADTVLVAIHRARRGAMAIPPPARDALICAMAATAA